MKIKNLHDCFVVKVMALYDTEIQITKALPKVIKGVENMDLKDALTSHLAETDEHVIRLEKIFEMMSMKPKKLKSDGAKGLIADVDWCLSQDATPAVMDSLAIAGVRYVEHHEMAGYMMLLDWAKLLNMEQAEELINETLAEEIQADDKLAALATEINEEANIMIDDADDDDADMDDGEP